MMIQIRSSVFAYYVLFSTLLAVYTEFTSHVTFKLDFLMDRACMQLKFGVFPLHSFLPRKDAYLIHWTQALTHLSMFRTLLVA